MPDIENKTPSTTPAEAKPVDWERVALDLAHQCVFALQHLVPRDGGLGHIINPKTGEHRPWKEVMADAVEAVPGATVDREMMHLHSLPSAQRHKAIDRLEKERSAKRAAGCAHPAEAKEPDDLKDPG